jgi:hypothetical protein
MSQPPPRPKDESPKELRFVPQPMVRWFDPVQLLGTAVQVFVSGFFGAYADKREVQAALAPGATVDKATYAHEQELWIDYVADLGDGFDSTYTVAYLLAQPALTIGAHATERGRILVMGGDQVYPTATRDQYENRLIGPYRAALPYVADECPHLYAIPGNHDWYDGLTSFIRFFCQKRYIGGWETKQDRSYFALKLPGPWWLWATDIQFDAYIDDPQLTFFRKASDELKEGERVILVTGKPSWVKGEEDHSYSNLRFFADEMLKDKPVKVAVTLSGDLHHYSRFEEEGGTRQLITAGGGGAYLSPTHQLPTRLEFNELGGKAGYRCASAYPTRAQSSRLAWRAAALLPLRNWRFTRVLALLYFLAVLLLQGPVRRAAPAGGIGWDDLPSVWWNGAVTSRQLIYAGLLVAGVTILFAAGGTGMRILLGLVHAIPHLFLLTVAVVLAVDVLGDIGWDWPPLIAAVAALAACVPGTMVMGLYLSVCDAIFHRRIARFDYRFERHSNEAFACQGIKDRKNFVRLHIDPDGKLTIYPVGVDRVLRKDDYELDTSGGPGAPYFRPKSGKSVEPRLIEEPIHVG